MFEQALCEVVAFILPGPVMRMEIVFDSRLFSLSGNVKQKAYKSALQAMLIGHCNGNQ